MVLSREVGDYFDPEIDKNSARSHRLAATKLYYFEA